MLRTVTRGRLELIEHRVISGTLKEAGEKFVKLQNLVFVAALSALAAPLSAYGGFIPPNLPAGSKYEIAFVTSGGTTAMAPSISFATLILTDSEGYGKTCPP